MFSKQEEPFYAKTEWILCPVCGSKTRTRMRADTTLTNFPLFCPKCKHEVLVNVRQMNMEIIAELVAASQSVGTRRQ